MEVMMGLTQYRGQLVWSVADVHVDVTRRRQGHFRRFVTALLVDTNILGLSVRLVAPRPELHDLLAEMGFTFIGDHAFYQNPWTSSRHVGL